MNELTQVDAFKAQARRSLALFAIVVCGTLLMVATAFAPLGGRYVNIACVLAAATGNAVLVAGYLMHLFTERKLIYALLAFTVIFFIGLIGLCIWATHDVPAVTSV